MSYLGSNKRKNIITSQDKTTKTLKIDDTTIIEEIILRIECGMASREMLNECKYRYLLYKNN